MDDGHFAWDDDKASQNVAKHGVSFEAARAVFSDPFAIEWVGGDDDELRFVVLGMAEVRLLFVIYTMRDEVIRLISARLAMPHERRRYHDDNAV